MPTVTVSTASSVDGRDDVLVENGGTYTTHFDLDFDPNPNGNEGNYVSVYMYATAEENGAIEDAIGGFNAEFNQYSNFPLYFDSSLSVGIPIEAAENGVAAYDPDASPNFDFSIFEIRLTEQNNTLTFTGFNDAVDDGPRTVYWNVIDNPNDGEAVSVATGSNPLIEVDDATEIPPVPAAQPVVSVSIADGTVGVEDDAAATAITISFSVEGDIPDGGLPIAFSLENLNVHTGLEDDRALGDFDLFAAIFGGGFQGVQLIRGWTANDGASVRLLQNEASITFQAFNDTDALPGDADYNTNTDFGPETTTVTLVNVDDNGTAFDGYTIATDAATATADLSDSAYAAKTTEDTDNSRSWTSRTTYKDDDGDLAVRYFDYDDGRGAYMAFEDGNMTARVTYDLSETLSWDIRTETFEQVDGARALARKVTFQDDGVVVTRDYEDGLITTKTKKDSADTFEWATRTKTYNDAGEMTGRTQVKDDGLTREFVYVDGALTSKTSTDAGDIRNWESRVDTYADGDLASRETTFDDGQILFEDFSLLIA